MNTLVECKGLKKFFGPYTALNDVSLTLERGRIIGLLGPNGSGKTTFIKTLTGLLTPNAGEILINGNPPGIESKKIISYLPDKNMFCNWMTTKDLIKFFKDFFEDFDENKAEDMLQRLNLNPNQKLKAMSKGTLEKVQLIMTMSRNASLYCLDEPIGGVDPASREYILNTIINNYSENASVLISTHLISEVESILDDVIFIKNGQVFLTSSVDQIREEKGMSVDALFREEFRC